MTTKPYRAFYESLLHDPRYLALSKEGVVALMTLRLLLGKSGLDRCGAGRVADGSPLSYEEAENALRELEETGWIEREGAIVWLIDALASEPNTSTRSEAVRKGIVGWVVGALGRDLTIVRRWAERYGLDLAEFDEERPASRTPAPSTTGGPRAKNKSWTIDALIRLEETEPTHGTLVGLVRQYLYINKTPAVGWDVERDGNILKNMTGSGVPPVAIAKAIVGLAWLRDDGKTELAAPGESLTLRPLWNVKAGPGDTFAAAVKYFQIGLRERAGRAA